ncbi:MAG TPA: Crp/Fnr family transcriptional regulator [Caulobacteraceae bacterium]|jgi:CRP-like cAMP-binding protein
MTSTERTLDAAMTASPILSPLSPLTRQTVAASGSLIALEPGALLCQQGDPGDAIFIVLEGEIEVSTRSLEGVQVRFASFGQASIIGEMAALDGGMRSADMIAVRRSMLWRIPRSTLIDALRAEPAAAVALIAELARRIRAANAAMEAMRTLDLGGRLARLLLEAMGHRSLVGLTQTEIARRLGASREKVNRKLNSWARRDWVELGPSGIRVLEPQSLAELIGAASHV